MSMSVYPRFGAAPTALRLLFNPESNHRGLGTEGEANVASARAKYNGEQRQASGERVGTTRSVGPGGRVVW